MWLWVIPAPEIWGFAASVCFMWYYLSSSLLFESPVEINLRDLTSFFSKFGLCDFAFDVRIHCTSLFNCGITSWAALATDSASETLPGRPRRFAGSGSSEKCLSEATSVLAKWRTSPLWGFRCDSAELWITQRQYAQHERLHKRLSAFPLQLWSFSSLTWAALIELPLRNPIRKSLGSTVAIKTKKKN